MAACIDDGQPTIYSSESNEDLHCKPMFKARPTINASVTYNDNARKLFKSLDGTCARSFHREMECFLRTSKAMPRLEDSQKDCISVLNQHYQSVFVERRKKSQPANHEDSPTPNNTRARQDQRNFRAFVQYFKFDEFGNKEQNGDTYVIRIKNNTLRELKNKIPHIFDCNSRYSHKLNPDDFRFFFKDHTEAYEEIESDNLEVPFSDKNNQQTIHCQVFMRRTIKSTKQNQPLQQW